MANANELHDKSQPSGGQLPRLIDNEKQHGHEFLPGGSGSNHVKDSLRNNGYVTQGLYASSQSDNGYPQSWQSYGPYDYLHYGARDQNKGLHGYPIEYQGDEDLMQRYSHDYTRALHNHDLDYHQWRNEQINSLDRDYHEYCLERYRKFVDDFNKWRSSRINQEQAKSDDASNSDDQSVNQMVSSQSGTAIPNKN